MERSKAPSRGGFAGLRILRINPQEEKTITFVANKWVGDLAEGEHSLRVMLHVPSTNRNWDPPSDLALAGQIEREFFLNLNVTAPCPGKLAKLADQDLTVIIGSSSVEIKKTASTHLSYISDVVAVPYMERAIIPDAVGNFDIIDGLARIDDERAKDALFRLAQSSDPSIAAYTHQIAMPPSIIFVLAQQKNYAPTAGELPVFWQLNGNDDRGYRASSRTEGRMQ